MLYLLSFFFLTFDLRYFSHHARNVNGMERRNASFELSSKTIRRYTRSFVKHCNTAPPEAVRSVLKPGTSQSQLCIASFVKQLCYN